MRFGWISDIHLDFLDKDKRETFYSMLDTAFVDVLLVGGDIGESDNIREFLTTLAKRAHVPVYFVLGNHDYYGSSIKATHRFIKILSSQIENLHYLSAMDKIIELSSKTALIGHDGWADLQYGNFAHSSVWMRDYDEIAELKGLKKPELPPVMEGLAQEAADHIRPLLTEAFAKYQHILILTHLPPFQEACWHEGKISDDEWLPHFTCKAMGDVIRELCEKNPTKSCQVLCGHTHGSGKARILNNLVVFTKGAEYEQIAKPLIASIK